MAKQSKSEQDGTVMSLPECASYLHLSDTTILKLATDGKLPGVLVNKKWQFQRDLVDQWLAERLDEDDELENIPDGMRVPLGDLLPLDAIIGDLQSGDAVGIIEELAALAYREKWLNDKPWFIGALIERESLSSTAMDGGVAFLHTRARDTDKIARPFIIAGRSYNGVNFGAPDGQKKFIFFLLGLKYDKLHLPILGRLARTMRNPSVVAKLRALPSPTKIRALLLEEDSRAMSSNSQTPVSYEAMKPKLDRQIRLRAIKRLQAMRNRQEEQEAKKRASAKKAARSRAKKKAASSADATGPAKKATAKKTTAAKAKTTAKSATSSSKKAASKTTTSKKTASKKTAGKKTASKKTASKKTASKKSS